MKILMAVDGSRHTKKALAYLVTHEELVGQDGELLVLHVQMNLPPRVQSALGADAVRRWRDEESAKVLGPVERFLKRHPLRWRSKTVVGPAAAEIVKLADKEGCTMIIMGTHGYGMLQGALMGSVTQSVLQQAQVPVLLVK